MRMNATTANCTYLNLDLNCSTNYFDTCNWLGIAKILASSPLGSGGISRLALYAEDELELEARCYNEEGIAYLSVSSWDRSKLEKLHDYAVSIGFKLGMVEIKGEKCECYV